MRSIWNAISRVLQPKEPCEMDEVLGAFFSMRDSIGFVLSEKNRTIIRLDGKLGQVRADLGRARLSANKAFCAALFFAGVLLIEAQALALWLLR
jgi:hypothetical protein